MRPVLAVAAAAGLVMAMGGAAHGKKDKGGRPGEPKPDATQPGEPEAKAEEKAKPKKELRVDVGGRVFYRIDAFRANDETFLHQDLTSARVEVTMRWQDWLRAVAEAELRGSVRDAYVRVRRGVFDARIDQFKPPVSALEL